MAVALTLAAILSAALSILNIKVIMPYYRRRYSGGEDGNNINGNINVNTNTGGICGLLWFAAGFTVFGAILLSGRGGLNLAATLFVGAFLTVISAVDIGYRKIPNELCFLIFLCGGAFGVFIDISLIEAIGGGAFAALPLILVKLFGGRIGMGDIKLMFAPGFFLGVWAAPGFFALTFILAAAFAFILLFIKKIDRKSQIPLAPFAAAAFVLAVYFDYFIIEFWRMI